MRTPPLTQPTNEFAFAQVGKSFPRIDYLNYLSSATFLDYDMIIIDLNTFATNMDTAGLPQLLRRKQELQEFLQYKHKFIVALGSNLFGCRVASNGVFKYADFRQILPFQFRVGTQEGTKMNYKTGHPLAEFIRRYEANFKYQGYFVEFTGLPVAETHLTKKTVAFYHNNTALIPGIDKFVTGSSQEFFSDLYKAFLETEKMSDSGNLPEWAETYQFPDEIKLRSDISDIEKQIQALQHEKDARLKQLEYFNELKTMFTESGQTLENIVQRVFVELGFTTRPTEPGRDDLILEYGNKIAVVEIKGVSKSASEQNATQLQKWISIFHHDHQQEPKGILVVNGFKDTELKNRQENVFPHQMIKFSTKNEHCLISTLQLLGMYLDAINDPAKKKSLIESLFTTIGVYDGYQKWDNFLAETNAQPLANLSV